MSVFKHRWVRWTLMAIVIGFLAIQLVPARVSNPSTRDEPAWDSPRTRKLAVAACFDCHSNQSHIVWWERIAPLSWWIKQHVDEGRDALNFSEWSTHRGEDDAAETVTNGSMPPDYYTWLGMHSNAKLTKAEQKELADGLRKTFAAAGIKGG